MLSRVIYGSKMDSNVAEVPAVGERGAAKSATKACCSSRIGVGSVQPGENAW